MGTVSAVEVDEEELELEEPDEESDELPPASSPPPTFSSVPPATVARAFCLHQKNWSVSCSNPRKVPLSA